MRTSFAAAQDIHVVDVDDARGHRRRRAGRGRSFSAPAWLPDGRTIAALGHRLDGRRREPQRRVAVRRRRRRRDADRRPQPVRPPRPDAGSGMSSDVTRGEGRGWSRRRRRPLARPQRADRRRVRAVADRRRRRPARAADRGPPLRLGLARGPAARGRGGTRIAYLRSTPTEPPDLWVLDTSAGRAPPVGRAPDLAQQGRPGRGRARASRSSARRRSTAATSRAGSSRRRRCHRPLVVEIHGGPHTLYGWSPIWEFQVLAAAGIGVFYCNPRGSEGYGEAFNDANHRDWGPGPTRDVLAGVDALVADGLADPERLGVTGGSYGGYLTNWIVAHDERFRAAMTCRSVSDMSDPVHDRRHRRRRLGPPRVRDHAVGGPGLLPGDLADRLRRPDPDAAAHPALGARHPDDDRPGRGAVHGPALAAPAGAALARARGDPRADPLGDALPAGREPARRRGLVPPFPGRRAGAGCRRSRRSAAAASARLADGPAGSPRGTRCILSVP